MDDNQTPEQASDETLVSEANTSEAEAEETTEADAEKGDEGTADDAGADSSEDDEDDDDEDERPKRKRKSGLSRLKRENETLKAELARRSQSQQQAGGADVEGLLRAKLGAPPREEDFPDFLSFDAERTSYRVAARIMRPQIEAELASQAAREQARQAEAIEIHEERVAEAEKKIPGLAAAIAKANVNIRNDIVPHIIESEKSALIAHYLSVNPKKAAELNGMTEKQAIKEIGRLEGRLSFPKTQTATKAPSPVRPPKGGTAGVMSPSQEIEAYIRRTYGR